MNEYLHKYKPNLVYNSFEEIADELSRLRDYYNSERTLIVDFTNVREG